MTILVQVAVVSVLPVAFVVGMLAGAFGRAGEAQEVALGLAEASADPALLDELVIRALGDPSARVYWQRTPANSSTARVGRAGRPSTRAVGGRSTRPASTSARWPSIGS